MSICIRQTAASRPNSFSLLLSYFVAQCVLIIFCRHNPLFYHLNLIPCHYWSWQRNIYFLVNIFVRHTFSMSKSSIKTKTVLTMTDMTQSTELQAFKRLKDGYKVAVKISLCICVVLSWDELKVRQNLLVSDYEICMVCLLVANVYWHIEP